MVTFKLQDNASSAVSRLQQAEALPRAGDIITFGDFAGTVHHVIWEETPDVSYRGLMPTVMVDLGVF
jgi:hypothetical protein